MCLGRVETKFALSARYWPSRRKRAALRCRGDSQRRRFAVQLSTLAAYRRFLRPHDEIPVRILNYAAYQLDLPVVIVADPPPKEDTDYEHQQRIRERPGFRSFDSELGYLPDCCKDIL